MRVVAFVALAACAGCGGDDDDLPRKSVSGTVTFEGQPLAQGRIQFEPSSPDARVTAGAEITDGRFAIPRDQGPTPGDYRIMVTSAVARKSGADVAPGDEPAKRGGPMLPAPAVELIPKEYNAQTKLTAKVDARGPNVFEFTLKK